MKVDPIHLAWWWVVLIVGFNIIFALQFMSDPLGLSPVLDARENLAWADKIDAHELPDEPFYRALLYPWVLSLIPDPQFAAPVLGVFCHLLNAFLCGLIGLQVWQDRVAAWLSGLIYGAYPVALFFAVQILDITFALSLFLMAVYWLLRLAGSPGWRFPLSAGLLVGLAVLARPNFLPSALLFPLIGGSIVYGQQKEVLRSMHVAVLVAAPMLLLFLAQGMINQRLSGEFRILPWQGSYNLYAANREGANGKFYKQRVSFDAVPKGMNTTRMESEYLYREATNGQADLDVGAMNAYWKERLVEEVAADPLRWIGLMGRKVFYVFNDWEQYNNLTYAFHKERFPVLRWNPLGWGVLLLGAFAGLVLGWHRMEKRRAIALALLVAAYTAGLLLFFVSARFRLPLVPLLCVFAGGLVFLSGARLRVLGRRGLLVSALAGTLLAILGYGNWFEARDRASFIQDELLLATASMEVGKDLPALEYANAVLARDPERGEAQRIRLSALFNLWLAATEPRERVAKWTRMEAVADEVARPDASTFFIRGVLAWRDEEEAAAINLWTEGLERFGAAAQSCARALQATGAGVFFEKDDPGVDATRRILERMKIQDLGE